MPSVTAKDFIITRIAEGFAGTKKETLVHNVRVMLLL